MVESNLQLIVDREDYRNQGLPFLDLIQEGTLGLVRRGEVQLPQGFEFSTYATWWIRQAIARPRDKARRSGSPSTSSRS